MYLEYDGLISKLRRVYFRKILKRFRIAKGARFLDYGCGPGDMLVIGNELGIEMRGVDSAERSVMMARERGLDVELGDYTNLQFELGHFDVIFLQSVIEHVLDPVEMTTALRRYLANDGLLILSSPTPGPHFWDDPTHIRPYTPRSFRTLAEICGCETIEINYVFSFLLGLRLKNSCFYKAMNWIPFALGSNIIGVFKKTDDSIDSAS